MFDIDGTLTAPRQRISPDFEEWFSDWLRDHRSDAVVFVTGSNYAKAHEQMGDLLKSVDAVYTCCGNQTWTKGSIIQSNSPRWPDDIFAFLEGEARASDWRPLADDHTELRAGSINFAVMGHKEQDAESRSAYAAHDEYRQERKAIADRFNQAFAGYSASLGGQVSIDITREGMDKGQVVARFRGQPIIFFGDRTDPGGNDYPIVKAMKDRPNSMVVAVKDFEQTKNALIALCKVH